MRTLKDSILEKLRVDDIVLTERFPIDANMYTIINFLEVQGFTLLKNAGESISDLFNKCHKRCIRNIDNILWFADTSKRRISRDNPVFYINYNGNDAKDNIFKVYSVDDIIINVIVDNDKEKFLEELNKRFGWQ